MREWMSGGMLLVLALHPSFSGAQNPPSARQLLQEALAVQGQESLIGVEVVKQATPTGWQRQIREIWRHQGMERIVVKEATPRTLTGQVQADNGKQTTQYFPPPYNVMFVRSSPTPKQRLQRKQKTARQLRSYHLRFVGPDTVAGRSTWIVELIPSRTDRPHRRVWLDQQTAVQLRMEERDRQGRLLQASFFEQVQLNPHPAPTPSDFTFTPPPDARIVDEFPAVAPAQRRVRFQILQPTYIPPGVFLEGVGVVRGPRQRVILRYNGPSGLFLLNEGLLWEEGPRSSRIPTQPASRRNGVFVWRAGNVILVLIGPRIQQSELKRMAQSVPSPP